MPQIPIVNNSTLNPSSSNTGGINWVAALNGANAWKMYPNTMDVLMDNVNENVFYIKTSDNIGKTSIRAFSYKEIQLDEVPIKDPNMPAQAIPQNVVTREDFDEFKSEILEAIKSNTHYSKSKRRNYNGGDQDER